MKKGLLTESIFVITKRAASGEVWSSTENSYNNAWNLNFNNGNRWNNNKNNSNYVRPVLAFFRQNISAGISLTTAKLREHFLLKKDCRQKFIFLLYANRQFLLKDWSSTENSANNSWNLNFSSGNRGNNNKNNSNYVRPVLAFSMIKYSGN